MNNIPECLRRHWIHSWEEDSDDIRTYRPVGSDLPLSRRPRHILAFEADHRFVSHVGGAADARITIEGRWDMTEPSRLTIQWEPSQEQTILDILECSDDLLRVRVLSGSIERPSGDRRGGGVD
jgi:hypothetical protein